MPDRHQLRTIVRGAYDIQKLRMQMGNRIVGNFKTKLGQEPGKKEEEMDAKGKAILADLRVRFKKITDGVKTFPRQKSFKGDEVISTYTELCLIAQYLELEVAEADHFKRLGAILKEYPIGVLGSSFLRAKDSPYADIYRDYKHRLESHARYGVHNDELKDDKGHKLSSKGRRHNMAIRYMVKRFFVDLYKAWRKLEGLPVAPEYHEAKLGHEHAKSGALVTV